MRKNKYDNRSALRGAFLFPYHRQADVCLPLIGIFTAGTYAVVFTLGCELFTAFEAKAQKGRFVRYGLRVSRLFALLYTVGDSPRSIMANAEGGCYCSDGHALGVQLFDAPSDKSGYHGSSLTSAGCIAFYGYLFDYCTATISTSKVR